MHLHINATYTINNLPEDTPNLKLLMKQRSKPIAECWSLLHTILQQLAKKQCTKNIVAMVKNTSEHGQKLCDILKLSKLSIFNEK